MSLKAAHARESVLELDDFDLQDDSKQTDASPSSALDDDTSPLTLQDVRAHKGSFVSKKELEVDALRKKSPVDTTNYFSILTFWWLNPLIKLGSKRSLDAEDVWEVPAEDDVDNTKANLTAMWKEELHGSEPSMPRAIRRSFGRRWLIGTLVHLLGSLSTFAQPYFIGRILLFIKDTQDDFTATPPLYEGFLFTLGLGLSVTFTSLMIGHMFYHIVRTASNVRAALIAMIYEKALFLTSAAKQGSSSGETVNLMSADTQRIFQLIILFNFLWISPLMITVVMVLLYLEIGPATFAGVGLMLLITPVQGVLAKRIARARGGMLKLTDERVKVVTEILSGIRVVKFYAWEGPFAERVQGIRQGEVAKLRSLLFTKAANLSIVFVWPILTSMSMFAVYVWTGNDLTTAKVFRVLALMNVLRFPIALLPMALHAFAEGRVSLARIRRFLLLPELQFRADLHSKDEVFQRSARNLLSQKQALPSNVAVSVKNGCFTWDMVSQDHPKLKNINMTVKTGELVGVVGMVGSGKSSLVSAILGEMHHISGSATVASSVAYMSQQNWIRNSTLRDNILFGLPYNKQLYRETIKAAALEPDMEVLPGGDQTEIGERGINLSGGQKARVSLARAVYRSKLSDIYILDDPFSAVDVHVGQHMFKACVMDKLRDKTRIIVLNSHLHFLQHFDRIYVMGKLPSSQEGPEAKDEMDGASGGAGQDSRSKEEEQSILMADERQTDFGIIDSGTYKELLVKYPLLLQASDHEEGSKQDHSGSRQARRTKRIDSDELSGEQPTISHVRGDPETSMSKKKDTYSSLENDQKLMTAEDRETGAVASTVYLQYFQAATKFNEKRGTLIMWVVFFAFLIGQTGRVVADWWLAIWSDKEVFGERDLNFWLGGYAIIVAVTFLLILCRSLLFVTISLRSSAALHDTLFRSLLHAPTNTFYDVTPIGRVINRFSKDLDQVDVMLPDFLSQLLQNGFHLFGALVVCCVSTPWFIILLLPISSAFYFIQDYFRKSSRELKRLEGISRSPIFSSFGETLNGLGTIRAYGLVKTFMEHNMFQIRANARLFFHFNMTSRWLAVRLDLISVCIIIAVGCLAIALRNTVSEALIGLALIYSLQFTGLLQWTVRVYTETENSMTAVERLVHYSKIDQEAAYDVPETEPEPQWPREGAITFKDLRVRYRPELDLVLKGIDCKIRPAEKIGICGRTGAGKSSLMVALYRLVEPDIPGSIIIDGVNTSNIGLRRLRQSLSIIPQDPVLFGGTLRYNLDPFNTVSDDDIWLALERVHLADAVRDMPEELNHAVAEYGENFSQGQRQLICIARALLRQSRIIILDEATASVDSETDQLIQETIRDNFKSKTVLTIAHRLDTILMSDRIMVLDHGRLAEFDTPDNLRNRSGGIFASMVSNRQ